MKLRITEGQYDRIKTKLSESVDSKYKSEVFTQFNYVGADLKGHEIEEVRAPKTLLNFDIDIEARTWGIKDINIRNISGPESIPIEVVYYVDDESTNVKEVALRINWDEMRIQTNPNSGMIGIDELEITLGTDGAGDLVATSTNITLNYL